MSTYHHTLDSKGRVIVPAKLRAELGDSFVVTLGVDKCLYGFPEEEWEKYTEELKKLPGKKAARDLVRHLFSGASSCDIDKQGRVLLPANAREYASMKKDVVFVGMMNKIEIWSKEEWEANGVGDIGNIEEAAEMMAELGLSL